MNRLQQKLLSRYRTLLSYPSPNLRFSFFFFVFYSFTARPRSSLGRDLKQVKILRVLEWWPPLTKSLMNHLPSNFIFHILFTFNTYFLFTSYLQSLYFIYYLPSTLTFHHHLPSKFILFLTTSFPYFLTSIVKPRFNNNNKFET